MGKSTAVLFLYSLLLLAGCSEAPESEKSEAPAPTPKGKGKSLKAFFFPMDTLTTAPTYLYRHSENPLDERYSHLIPKHKENDTAFIIEKFNPNLKLTEGLQLNIKNKYVAVKGHKVANGQSKFNAKIISDGWFPLYSEDTVHFKSLYPENDSVVQIWDQLRMFDHRGDSFAWKGQKLPSIYIKNSTRVFRVDKKNNRQQKAAELTFTELWVKGLGLVRVQPGDTSQAAYHLDKIISNTSWQRIMATQSRKKN